MSETGKRQRAAIVVTLAALILATAALAGQQVTNRAVAKRMAAMGQARTSIDTLGDMMANRVYYDARRAKAARKSLIKVTRSIPSLFRKPHTDPLSSARPLIWVQWTDFKRRGKAAARTARDLDVSRLQDLRRTLPPLLGACLDCHRRYRR